MGRDKNEDLESSNKKKNSSAAQRLDQLSAHITNNNNPDSSNHPVNKPEENTTQTTNQKQKKKTTLPADYSDILTQLSTLRSIAATPDPTNRGYIRQKQAGKLWVRERIEQLLDKNTFKEIGSVTGTVTWKQPTTDNGSGDDIPLSFTPSNNVQGLGKLRGRTVLLTVDDFTIRGGHADGATMEKTVYVEKLAIALKLPIVKLVDGSSGGGSVTTIRKAGWSYVPDVSYLGHVVKQLNMGIPNLGAVVGPAVCIIILQLPFFFLFGCDKQKKNPHTFGKQPQSLTRMDNDIFIIDRPRRSPSCRMPLLRHGRRYRLPLQCGTQSRRKGHFRRRPRLPRPRRTDDALHQRDNRQSRGQRGRMLRTDTDRIGVSAEFGKRGPARAFAV
jgi:hypothetical protein